MTPYTPHIWFLPHREYGDRPCLAYIRGRRDALLVDAGNSPAHARQLLDALHRMGAPAPRFIALTHGHWDHCFGLPAFPQALSFATAETNRQLHRLAAWRWDDASMKARVRSGEEIPFCHVNIKREYPDRSQIRVEAAQVALQGPAAIDLGGLCCRLIPLENCHLPGHLVVSIPQDRALILGDILCPDYRCTPPRYTAEGLSRLIAGLEALDFDTALPGHNAPMTRAALFADLHEALCRCR